MRIHSSRRGFPARLNSDTGSLGMRQWQRRILGVLATGGGFTGLAVGLTLLITPGSVLAKAFCLPFLALYIWGIVCGLCLLEDRPGAVKQNFYFWLVQIPHLMSPAIGYSFSSGASLYFIFQPDISKWDFSARLGSQFAYSLFQGMPFALGINFIAVLVCGYFLVLLRRSPHGNDTTGFQHAVVASQHTESASPEGT